MKVRRGDKSYNWKGGVTYFYTYFRHGLEDWKKESMKSSNYKCIISSLPFEEIHHLHSFKKILSEFIENYDKFNLSEVDYNTKVMDISLLFENENIKEEVRDDFIAFHNTFPLGVCLTKKIHTLYHEFYGDDNTPEQFEEFKQNYNNGLYEEKLNIELIIV